MILPGRCIVCKWRVQWCINGELRAEPKAPPLSSRFCIWPPCGPTLTGGIQGSMWSSNPASFLKFLYLTSMWSYAERWNARLCTSDSSIQINVICFIWLQLISLMKVHHCMLMLITFIQCDSLLSCTHCYLVALDCMLWRFCSEPTSLLPPYYTLAWEGNMAATLWVSVQNINCDVVIGWNPWVTGCQEPSMLNHHLFFSFQHH